MNTGRGSRDKAQAIDERADPQVEKAGGQG
jgi:hypothetical protein